MSRSMLDPLTGPWWDRTRGDAPAFVATVALHGDPAGLDDPPTVPIPLLPATTALPVLPGLVEDRCPACGARGDEPCRPRRNPAGRPLPSWHRARPRVTAGAPPLTEVGAAVADVVVGVVGALLAVALLTLVWLNGAARDVPAPAPLDEPCAAPTLFDPRLRPCVDGEVDLRVVTEP